MRRLVSDTLIIAERNLVRLPRAPDLLLAFTVQPIMFVLLFRYVFGGAIASPRVAYVDYLIPGIIVQNIAFGGFVTALGLNEDLHKGLIDRFRSLPMARPAVLAGRTLADIATNALSMTILLVTGVIIGFSFHNGVGQVVLGMILLAAVRLRVLVDLRLPRAARLLARGGQLGRLHRRLPAHLHLLGLRARELDAGGPALVCQHQPVLGRRQRDALAVGRLPGPQLRVGRVRVVRGDHRHRRPRGRHALPARRRAGEREPRAPRPSPTRFRRQAPILTNSHHLCCSRKVRHFSATEPTKSRACNAQDFTIGADTCVDISALTHVHDINRWCEP